MGPHHERRRDAPILSSRTGVGMTSKNERDEVEEFLYEEAALLDAWDLRKWQ
jgi:hypothetical protein